MKQLVAGLFFPAKRSPGALSFASLGSSSPHYLGFEWWKRMEALDILGVPPG